MQFGFIGLGQMGAPMAQNLLAQHPVTVMAQNADALALLARKDAEIASVPQDFRTMDVLILSLPDAKTVTHVLFDTEAGVAIHLKPGTIIIDTGTTEYQTTQDIGVRLAQMGLRFLDAPVSGMQKRAEDATLTMMVGGEAAALKHVEPALATMASKILHMGDVGAGQLTKLINQLLLDINAAALAEILPMASLLGLDPDKTTQVINSGTGRSYASEFFIPHILRGSFTDGYPMQAAYKDLISGADISARHNIPTPVLAAATATYQQALREGHGAKDKGAMVLVYERLLGTAFRSNPDAEDT